MLIVLGLGACVTQSVKETELWEGEELNSCYLAVCSAHILILTMENERWKTSELKSGLKRCDFSTGIVSSAACFDSPANGFFRETAT